MIRLVARVEQFELMLFFEFLPGQADHLFVALE